jgi:hypothetical protein
MTISVRKGQRWHWKGESHFIAEALEDKDFEDNHSVQISCKVVQNIMGHWSLNTHANFYFGDNQDRWTYLVGQDAPAI